MDYDALASVLPRPANSWTEQQVGKWLQFVHLESLAAIFSHHRLNGQRLISLTLPQLQMMGVTNSIIQRKLIRWIKEGFAEFESFLAHSHSHNKENIPPPHLNLPLQRKMTTEREGIRPNCNKRSGMVRQEDEMVVRSCDGNLAAFYVMRERSLKIGRSSLNTIRSLEVSVENEHAEVMRHNGKYYLRDMGTEAGTFIKVEGPKVLGEGNLVQMGSFLLQVEKVDLQARLLLLGITHMISKGSCELTVALQDGCSSFTFGRRKNNDFSFDDEHLSGMHARIFLLHGQFVLQDLHSTNGTWLRLSRPFEPSGNFLLQDGYTFKVGTTITYNCEGQKAEQRMEVQYDDTCVHCNNKKRNILMLPCRHNILCSECAQPIYECPMCRSEVQQKIKIYI